MSRSFLIRDWYFRGPFVSPNNAGSGAWPEAQPRSYLMHFVYSRAGRYEFSRISETKLQDLMTGARWWNCERENAERKRWERKGKKKKRGISFIVERWHVCVFHGRISRAMKVTRRARGAGISPGKLQVGPLCGAVNNDCAKYRKRRGTIRVRTWATFRVITGVLKLGNR